MDIELSDDGGTTWTPLETVPDTPSVWVERTVRILDHVALTSRFQMRLIAVDDPNNSITEAALDAVLIDESDCQDPICTYADINDDGLVNAEDIGRFADVLVNGGGSPQEICAGDLHQPANGVIDMDDVDDFVACLLAGGC
jgi:hypothetical protein